MIAAVIAEQEVQTRHGQFSCRVYRGDDGSIGAALWQGDPSGDAGALARVHSSCFTSEALGAIDCDCAAQLDMALESIAARQSGVIFYLLQEGRGAGLLSKAKDRMVVQTSRGTIDTFAAYVQFGIDPDPRQYDLVPAICADLGITSLRLMTNNPAKILLLAKNGLRIEPLPLRSAASPYNSEYLAAKAKSGHIFDVPAVEAAIPPAWLEEADPHVERLGRFLRIASYDLPVRVLGDTTWFRATAYTDESGDCARLVLTYRCDFESAPILQVFPDQLFDRFSGESEATRRYRAALKRMVARGSGSILAIPDDANWLNKSTRATLDDEIELLRCHTLVSRSLKIDG